EVNDAQAEARRLATRPDLHEAIRQVLDHYYDLNRIVFDNLLGLTDDSFKLQVFVARHYLEHARAILDGSIDGIEQKDSRWQAAKELIDQIDQLRNVVAKAAEDGKQGANADVGGISFDRNFLDLQIKRDPHGVPLPFSQQPIDQIRIKGLTPMIIQIAPINVDMLLGKTEAIERRYLN
ncbi:MAG: hypothetical protein NUV91_03190, partial [Candidatus Omnitrophica bacterium]|nr:hypothetical protein [Candidatus Omnitrophota bacterium]